MRYVKNLKVSVVDSRQRGFSARKKTGDYESPALITARLKCTEDFDKKLMS